MYFSLLVIFHGECFEITCENKNYIIFPQKEGKKTPPFLKGQASDIRLDYSAGGGAVTA